ncbi:MAG: hydrogenase iron-sulfur subunit [Desulfarculus sp.]|nr:hydrogenase iron-sulfur subunit [Desulfarculus sp.]
MKSPNRYGVFLCQGGHGGQESLDFKRLRWTAEAQGVPVFEVTQACAQEGAAAVARLTGEGGFDSFILGACPLAGPGGPLAGELWRAGLKPEMVQHLDLCQKPLGQTGQCLVMDGGALALDQALVAQAARFQPESREMEVSRRVLVLGSGLLALKAARGLLLGGYKVLLITPGRRLAPPEPLLGLEAKLEATALARELEAAERLEVVSRGELLRLAGSSGGFTATVLDRQRRRWTRRAGAVLVTQGPPTRLNSGDTGLEAGPRVVSLSDLLIWLSSPEHFRKKVPRQGQPRVGLAVGLGQEASPMSLRAACLAARGLVSELGAEVTLFTSQAKMAAPDLEELTQEVRGLGVVFVKFDSHRPQASPRPDGVGVSYFEEILGRELSQDLDLVAVDEVPGPGQAWRGLARVLGLAASGDGSLQPDQVNALPTASARAGVFLLGPASGAWDLPAALDQVGQALAGVRALLGQGKARVEEGRVRVDRRRCAICLTCVRVCPRQAMGRQDRRPEANPLACTACGTCASECPMEAIQIAGQDDQRFAREIGAAVSKSPSGLLTAPEREMLVFACANSAGPALAAARLAGRPWPSGVRLVQVPCAGKVDPAYVLWAFQQGLDGVLVLGCYEDACHSLTGSTWAAYRAGHLRRLLTEAGCDPRRLISAGVAPGMHAQVMDMMEQARQRVEGLGANPLKTQARVREFLSRFTVRIDETYAIAG